MYRYFIFILFIAIKKQWVYFKLSQPQAVCEYTNHGSAPVGVLTNRNQKQHPIAIGFKMNPTQATHFPQELSIRNGLKNFHYKLKHNKGDTINVAFLGGSITQADNGWRDKTFAWLQQQNPTIKLKQINAGIGGTGSDLGVYRLDEQVLQYKPDMLFIEFAVNDADAPRAAILKAIEGIVRKTKAKNCHTDICFVNTFYEAFYKQYLQNKLPASVSAMEEIAAYYQLPSINVGLPIVDLLNKKSIFLKGASYRSGDSSFFSGDGVHPYPETGHQQYFQTVSSSLKKIFAANPTQKKVKSKPYFSNVLQKAGMKNLQPYMLQGNIQQASAAGDAVAAKFASLMPQTIILNDTAQQITFRFTGSRIGFMDVLTPSSGEITVYVDEEKPRMINRFDKYCFYFSRMHWFFIEGLSAGTHSIRIKLSPQQPDKFLLLEQGKEKSTLEKPEEYKKYSWRAGKILTDGWIGK